MYLAIINYQPKIQACLHEKTYILAAIAARSRCNEINSML